MLYFFLHSHNPLKILTTEGPAEEQRQDQHKVRHYGGIIIFKESALRLILSKSRDIRLFPVPFSCKFLAWMQSAFLRGPSLPFGADQCSRIEP